MSTRRLRTGIAALAALGLLATACGDGGGGEGGGDNGADAPAADVSEFRIAWNAQPPTLDPVVTTATTTRDISRNIYESLVSLDEDNEVQNVLASEHRFEDDGRSIVFTLREGVVFHDGSPMEAEDVVASLERWIAVSSTGQQFFEGTEVSTDGASTVTVTTPDPMYTAIHLLADPGIMAAVMPREIVESAPPEGTDQYIGTGPYAFVSWPTDQHIHLERFEDYQSAEGEPSGMAGAKEAVFENLYYDFVSDPSTRLAGLQTGEYDAANALSFDNYDQLQNNPDLQVIASDNGFNGLVFNKRNGLMADVLMRRAVSAALDMEEVQRASFANPDFYNLNGALMMESQGEWYTDAGLEHYNLNDPDLVAELLEEAGYDGEPVRILTTREYDDHYNHAIVVEAQLNAVGINAELIVTDWATVLENRTDDTAYEIFITGFSPATVPTRFVFLTSTWPGWTDDPGIDAGMDLITYAADAQEAEAATADLQIALYDYLPIVKFGDKSTITALRADIEGYEFLPGAGDIFFRVHPAE